MRRDLLILAVVKQSGDRRPALYVLRKPLHEAETLRERHQSVPPAVDHLGGHPHRAQGRDGLQQPAVRYELW